MSRARGSAPAPLVRKVVIPMAAFEGIFLKNGWGVDGRGKIVVVDPAANAAAKAVRKKKNEGIAHGV